jgi:hypothetical protein
MVYGMAYQRMSAQERIYHVALAKSLLHATGAPPGKAWASHDMALTSSNADSPIQSTAPKVQHMISVWDHWMASPTHTDSVVEYDNP